MNSTRDKPIRKVPQVRPFAISAMWYYDCGWAPFPVWRNDQGRKAPAKRGVTGREGRDATYAQITDWLRGRTGDMNVGLRPPLWLMGLDVDGYDGRLGADTLRTLEARLGPLPPTYRVTSRLPEDHISGIRLYQIPEGMELEAIAGPGIEIVQHHHRFLMAPPSLHPGTGRRYAWYWETTEAVLPVAEPDSFPALPAAWRGYLRSQRAAPTSQHADPAAASEWYRAVSGGRQCPHMRRVATSAAQGIRQAALVGGLHDEMCRVTWLAVHYAAEGHRGLDAALTDLRGLFVGASRRRSLTGEWDRALADAIAHAAAAEQSQRDPCAELLGMTGGMTRGQAPYRPGPRRTHKANPERSR